MLRNVPAATDKRTTQLVEVVIVFHPCADALALRSRLSTGQTTRSTFFFKFLFCTFFRREVTRQGLDQHELGDCRERPLACMKKTPRVRRGNGTTAIWNGSHANFGNEISPHTRERTTNGKGDETPSPRTSELENTSAPKWNMWCLVACSSQARNCFRGLRTRDMTPSLRTPHLYSQYGRAKKSLSKSCR